LPRSVKLLKLVYNEKIDNSAKQAEAISGNRISGNETYLMFNKADKKDSSITFNMSDDKTFEFNLKYWPSYVQLDNCQNSGAYDFRPIDNLFEPLPYSHLNKVIYSKGKISEKFILFFSKTNKRTKKEEKKAIVHVTLDQELKVAKFDVDLDTTPGGHLDGYEVVAQFKAHDFDNNATFYTDSNGLEMQKRILNYRSYYDVTEMYYAHQNITANYYPVNSAISLKDSTKKM